MADGIDPRQTRPPILGSRAAERRRGSPPKVTLDPMHPEIGASSGRRRRAKRRDARHGLPNGSGYATFPSRVELEAG